MDDDLNLGLYIIVVLCLVVLAMSAYKVAFGNDSYMTNRFATSRSDFMGSGAVEAPVFWNMGSVEETNKLQQEAALQMAKDAAADAASPESFTNRKDFDKLEGLAGAGL